MNQVNIVGTQNVIDACRKHGVPQLIYTSSASVVFSGGPLVDVDESHPYADPPMDFYTGTKAEVRLLGPSLGTVTLATRIHRPGQACKPCNVLYRRQGFRTAGLSHIEADQVAAQTHWTDI
jgi:nucleoside-diphosphate-sugar epimerase